MQPIAALVSPRSWPICLPPPPRTPGHLLADHLAQLVDILEQHVVVGHGPDRAELSLQAAEAGGGAGRIPSTLPAQQAAAAAATQHTTLNPVLSRRTAQSVPEVPIATPKISPAAAAALRFFLLWASTTRPPACLPAAPLLPLAPAARSSPFSHPLRREPFFFPRAPAKQAKAIQPEGWSSNHGRDEYKNEPAEGRDASFGPLPHWCTLTHDGDRTRARGKGEADAAPTTRRRQR